MWLPARSIQSAALVSRSMRVAWVTFVGAIAEAADVDQP
jgi:hypothetical protein